MILLFYRNKSIKKKYYLTKEISKPFSICDINQPFKLCIVSNGIHWNLWKTKKLAINMNIFAVSEVLGGSDWNRNANGGTETDVAILIFI